MGLNVISKPYATIIYDTVSLHGHL